VPFQKYPNNNTIIMILKIQVRLQILPHEGNTKIVCPLVKFKQA